MELLRNNVYIVVNDCVKILEARKLTSRSIFQEFTNNDANTNKNSNISFHIL